jgi:heat shock protein HslJ
MRYLFLAAALVLSACATSEDRAQAPTFNLAGTSWQAVEIASLRDLRGDHIPTIEFVAPARIRGHGGCNPYGAHFNAFADRLEIDGVVGGANDCDADVVTRQNTLLSILSESWSYEVEGDTLTIHSIDRRFVRFRRAA